MTEESDHAFSKYAYNISKLHGFHVCFEDCYAYSPTMVAARFSLNNGLKIVLMKDDRSPSFTYQSWFKVGSADEDPELTGMAHLFEHLMFKGTANNPIGTFDREMERRGSETNAATWVDWTYYTQTLAHRDGNLETVVAFEADRMTNLRLDEKTFRSELEVVKNERRLTVDDSVAGSMSEALYGLVFDQHGYRWPTIGSMAHLDAANIADLQAFYERYYAPNNATIVLVGAIDVEYALGVIAAAYGPLSSQPCPPRHRLVELRQTAARSVTLKKRLAAPLLLVAFRAPAQSDSAYACLEVLGNVMVSGESSRLYRRLVLEERLVLDLTGYVTPFIDPGVYQFGLQCRPNVDPEVVLSLLQEELDRLGDGVSDKEQAKSLNNLELSFYLSLKDTEGCAEALGHYETNEGDYRLAFQDMDRWRNVNQENLVSVARQVFSVSNRTTAMAMPL